jgi:hypothetical protein
VFVASAQVRTGIFFAFYWFRMKIIRYFVVIYLTFFQGKATAQNSDSLEKLGRITVNLLKADNLTNYDQIRTKLRIELERVRSRGRFLGKASMAAIAALMQQNGDYLYDDALERSYITKAPLEMSTPLSNIRMSEIARERLRAYEIVTIGQLLNLIRDSAKWKMVMGIVGPENRGEVLYMAQRASLQNQGYFDLCLVSLMGRI